jgi:hypothetical protein
MIKRGEHIRFALEILDDGLPDQQVGRSVDHLLHRNQFNHIGEVQVTRAVNRPHAAHTDYILNTVAANQRDARLKLLLARTGTTIRFKADGRGDIPSFQSKLLRRKAISLNYSVQ